MLKPIPGGTYAVSDDLLEDLKIGKQGQHASNLGGILAREIGDEIGVPSYIVDPVVVDDLMPIARYSGLEEIPRGSIFHALNQKAVAKRYAKEAGKPYESLRLIVVHMGGGVSGMFETILVTLLVASLCGLIRAYGGFESILAFIRRVFRGKRGGQLGIGLLVGLMDIATANNTVAIVMAGPIAKEVEEEYGISPKRSASRLDTFSCIFQGIIPYGAQMLVAISTCATLGYAISAFDIIPLLF